MGILSGILVSLVLFSGLVTGLFVFYSDFTTNYEGIQGTTNISSMSVISDINERMASIEERTQDMTSDDIITSGLAFLTSGAEATLLVLASFSIVQNTATEVVSYLGLPAWFLATIVTIIVVVMITAVLSVLMKWDI